jgi:hypothetical protein
MRELLILLLMAAVGFLVYDDHSKRTSLEQAQGQIQQLTSEREQLRQNPVRLNVRVPTAPTPPAWFQKQLDEGSSLEMSRRHRHQSEDSTANP